MAILAVSIGFGLFAVSDSLLKLMTSGLKPIDVLCYHGLFGALALGIYFTIGSRWRSFSSRRAIKWQVLRGLMSTTGCLVNLYALQFISLDEFYAVAFSAPIMTSLFSVILLKEHVAWRRWAGIISGFIGVLIVMDPFGFGGKGPNIDPHAFLCLISACLFSLGSILLRRIQTNKPLVLGFAFIPFVTHLTVPLLLLTFTGGNLSPLAMDQAAILAATGVFGAIGAVLVARAFSMAEASIVAPFHYTQMFWGILIGYFLFQDVPNIQTLAGCAVIIGSGLFILYRERVVRRRQGIVMINHTPLALPKQ